MINQDNTIRELDDLNKLELKELLFRYIKGYKKLERFYLRQMKGGKEL